jgi:hypothetical protein
MLKILVVVWAVLQVLWPANPSAVIELWAVEAFVLRLLLLATFSWLVLSMLEMQVSLVPLFRPSGGQ